MKRRRIGVGAIVVLLASLLTTGGCDVIEKFKQKAKDKSAEAASAEPSGPLSADPDEALGLKLNGPIECINSASGQVFRSRDRYVSWFPDAKVGPTGKEKIVYGLYKVTPTFVERCKKELAGYRKVKEPPTADLDKLADAFEAKLDAVVPLIETAAKYYEAKDYEDDKLAKAKTMHPGLMKAFDEFGEADKGLRAEIKKLKGGMADRELAKVEKGEGKKLRWNHLKTNMVAEKVVQMGDEDLTKLDTTAFETLLKEYEAQVDALDAYVKANSAEAGKVMMYSTYQGNARKLLNSAKAVLRRARDKKPFSDGDIMMINAGNPQMIEGHPAHLVNAYNDMIKGSNNLHW